MAMTLKERTDYMVSIAAAYVTATDPRVVISRLNEIAELVDAIEASVLEHEKITTGHIPGVSDPN
jgi:hypothetical protein